eukprot:CAMPEP_0202398870 /NCGR_PEP_ID=MMETSP1128-20130828/1608_1 /ASSEMBLY_ACC=CAM_ASM_000463 /TAXON_ID=3047 /ORGANISM="Dunaliella tertiolecta, Strain CCMP1320" /LENGTH=65 /DNA_ID=CAMNT_0049002071 /DNA_START=544 /DNA_END=741 /DNA_ORIENTATION=-
MTASGTTHATVFTACATSRAVRASSSKDGQCHRGYSWATMRRMDSSSSDVTSPVPVEGAPLGYGR